MKIINYQRDIKLGQFTQKGLNVLLKNIENRKAAGPDEIPPEVWEKKKFDDLLLRYCNAVYKQNTTERRTIDCILPFPKKGDIGITKNY